MLLRLVAPMLVFLVIPSSEVGLHERRKPFMPSLPVASSYHTLASHHQTADDDRHAQNLSLGAHRSTITPIFQEMGKAGTIKCNDGAATGVEERAGAAEADARERERKKVMVRVVGRACTLALPSSCVPVCM